MTIGSKELMVPLGNSIIQLEVEENRKPIESEKVQPIEEVLPKLMRSGTIQPWNPWRKLPLVILLSSAMLLSIGIVSSTQTPGNVLQAMSFAISSITIVLTLIALSIWFANLIGTPS